MPMRMRRRDPSLSPAEWRKLRRLTRLRVTRIDAALLAQASFQWRKVARVVGTAMMESPRRIAGVSDLYYAKRVRVLVRRGVLQAQGNLNAMRYSEVRLVQKVATNAI